MGSPRGCSRGGRQVGRDFCKDSSPEVALRLAEGASQVGRMRQAANRLASSHQEPRSRQGT